MIIQYISPIAYEFFEKAGVDMKNYRKTEMIPIMKVFNVFYTLKNGIALSALTDAYTSDEAAEIVRKREIGCVIRKVKLWKDKIDVFKLR